MNKSDERMNKYFAVNAVGRSVTPSFPDQKMKDPVKVSDKELAERVYFWDPILRQFIKFGRGYER